MPHILAIHAHPDDVEILAGGTLVLLAERGHPITIATFTPGDCGSRDLGSEEIAAVRRREAASAARQIGAQYLCLEMRDLAIFNDDACRRRVTEALRQTRPQIVLAPSPVDYLCDHETASVLVRDACFAAPLPNYRTASAPIQAIPHLYFMDPVAGRDREGRVVQPDFVVDVSATFESKRQMLAEHASQREWLRHHHGVDEYLLEMERWTRERARLQACPMGRASGSIADTHTHKRRCFKTGSEAAPHAFSKLGRLLVSVTELECVPAHHRRAWSKCCRKRNRKSQ